MNHLKRATQIPFIEHILANKTEKEKQEAYDRLERLSLVIIQIAQRKEKDIP